MTQFSKFPFALIAKGIDFSNGVKRAFKLLLSYFSGMGCHIQPRGSGDCFLDSREREIS